MAPNGDLPLPPPRSARRRRSPRLGTPQGSPCAAAAGESSAAAAPAPAGAEAPAGADTAASSREPGEASAAPDGPAGQGAGAADDLEMAGGAEEELLGEAPGPRNPAGHQSAEALALERGEESQSASAAADCRQAMAGEAAVEQAAGQREAAHTLGRPPSGAQSTPSRGHAGAPVPAPGPLLAAAAMQAAEPDEAMRGTGVSSTVGPAAVPGAGGGECTRGGAGIEQEIMSGDAGCPQRPAVPRRQRGKRRSRNPGAAWTARSSEEPEEAGRGKAAWILVPNRHIVLLDPQAQQCRAVCPRSCALWPAGLDREGSEALEGAQQRPHSAPATVLAAEHGVGAPVAADAGLQAHLVPSGDATLAPERAGSAQGKRTVGEEDPADGIEGQSSCAPACLWHPTKSTGQL